MKAPPAKSLRCVSKKEVRQWVTDREETQRLADFRKRASVTKALKHVTVICLHGASAAYALKRL